MVPEIRFVPTDIVIILLLIVVPEASLTLHLNQAVLPNTGGEYVVLSPLIPVISVQFEPLSLDLCHR
jgi:hypothetical protein